MQHNVEMIDSLIAGRAINGVMFGKDCFELHQEDDILLKIFVFPRVVFNADDMAERLAHASVSEKLVNLVGKRIRGLRKDAMGDYAIAVEDFAVLSVGDGQSISGRTGLVVSETCGTILF